MIRQPTLLALCVSLALGTAQAAPEPDPGVAIPRVACDLLDVRTAAAGPRADPVGAGESPPAGAPTIRQVGGLDPAARRTSSAPERRGGFLRVAMGPSAGQAPAVAMELGPRNVSITPGTTALIEIAIDHLEPRHALRKPGGANRLGGQHQRRWSCGLRGHVDRGTRVPVHQRRAEQ